MSWNFLLAELSVVPYITNRQILKDVLQRLGKFLGKVQNYFNFLLLYELESCLMQNGNVRLLEVKIRVDETEQYQAYFQPLKQNHHRGSRRNATEGPAIEKSPYSVSYKYRYFSHCPLDHSVQQTLRPFNIHTATNNSTCCKNTTLNTPCKSEKWMMGRSHKCQSEAHHAPWMPVFLTHAVSYSTAIHIPLGFVKCKSLGSTTIISFLRGWCFCGFNRGKRKKMKTFYGFDSLGINLEKMGASFTKYILHTF